MGIPELVLLALGLAMDAFAVSICTGLTMQPFTFRKALTIGLYFGIFQAVMPLLGYLVGSQFADKITAFDHWIAFGLLALIGGKMIKESFEHEEPSGEEASLRMKAMLPLAIATSIDALAVGVLFALQKVNVFTAIAWIGSITLVVSMAGVKIGHVFGSKFKSKAEFAGGVLLVLIGLRILLEHLGILVL